MPVVNHEALYMMHHLEYLQRNTTYIQLVPADYFIYRDCNYAGTIEIEIMLLISTAKLWFGNRDFASELRSNCHSVQQVIHQQIDLICSDVQFNAYFSTKTSG